MIHSSIHNISRDMTPLRRCTLIFIACIGLFMQAQGQFAPAVGLPGSTALRYDSLAFVAWATGCTVERGYQNVAAAGAYASAGDSSGAVGIASGGSIVSLGDGGSAILTFAEPVVNGTGFDFAVFENGFTAGGPGMAFLELAFVEVSSDGVRYVRFPAIDDVQDSMQIGNGGAIEASKLYNLAGKYTSGYGTPFDLDELRDSAGLDINNITHIRVVDVIGSINDQYATRDSRGHKINDPYPTAFASSGFDLDAVGVIHQRTISAVDDIAQEEVSVYPNPASNLLHVRNVSGSSSCFSLTDLSGRIVHAFSFDKTADVNITSLPAGIYVVRITGAADTFSKLIVKE